MDLIEMHLGVPRELSDEIPKPLSIMFEKLLQSNEVPTDYKRENITLIFIKGKRRTWGTTGQSVLPAYLVKLWSRHSWKLR